jgi:excisionase family DNA binding protein
MSFATVFEITLNGGTEVRLMDRMPDEVLTIEELASYLKIPKSTLYKLVREGKVPCQKIGRHWRFRRGAIDHWLAESHTGDAGSTSN